MYNRNAKKRKKKLNLLVFFLLSLGAYNLSHFDVSAGYSNSNENCLSTQISYFRQDTRKLFRSNLQLFSQATASAYYIFLQIGLALTNRICIYTNASRMREKIKSTRDGRWWGAGGGRSEQKDVYIELRKTTFVYSVRWPLIN